MEVDPTEIAHAAMPLECDTGFLGPPRSFADPLLVAANRALVNGKRTCQRAIGLFRVRGDVVHSTIVQLSRTAPAGGVQNNVAGALRMGRRSGRNAAQRCEPTPSGVKLVSDVQENKLDTRFPDQVQVRHQLRRIIAQDGDGGDSECVAGS